MHDETADSMPPRRLLAMPTSWLIALVLLVTPIAVRGQQPEEEQTPAEGEAVAAQEPEEEAAAVQPFVTEPVTVGAPPLLGRIEEQNGISLEVGSGFVLTLPLDVHRVALADDRLALVQMISTREVLLTGQSSGKTTLFVWLADGQRQLFPLRIRRDVRLLEQAVRDLDPRIVVEPSVDGRSIVLRGEVASGEVARQARERAEALVRRGAGGGQIVELLRYPDSDQTNYDLLLTALEELDPRIELHRIAGGREGGPEAFVLYGDVKSIHEIRRAITLVELHIGGTAGRIVAPDDDPLRVGGAGNRRGSDNFGGGGGGGAGGRGGLGGGGFIGGGGGLQGLPRPPSGLASQVSRNLVLTSSSGRVISYLEVDELPQILVSIRVYEIDRAKSREAGIDFSFRNEQLALGFFTRPPTARVNPGLPGGTPTLGGIVSGNIVGAFVDGASAIAAAIDFMETKQLARSVAEPNILTLSGEQASVLVGGEIPVATTAVNNVASVQGFFFTQFGVRMSIRPTLDEDNIVSMEVSPSIIRPELALSIGGAPGFTVQSVSTTARVMAGQTLVIGGLISFEEGEEERGIPYLRKIPIFRWTRKTRSERELLFIITPRVLQPEWDEPGEPVEKFDESKLELPQLDFPEGRRRWKDEFEPGSIGRDGIPKGLRVVQPKEILPPEQEPEVWRETFDNGVDPAEPEGERGAPFVVRESVQPCLSFRPQPSTWSEAEECLPPGARIEGFERRDGWREIQLHDGRRGWVVDSFVRPQPLNEDGEPIQLDVNVEPRECLYLRRAPSSVSAPIDCLSPGTLLSPLEQRDGWYRVQTPDGREGWVTDELVEENGGG